MSAWVSDRWPSPFPTGRDWQMVVKRRLSWHCVRGLVMVVERIWRTPTSSYEAPLLRLLLLLLLLLLTLLLLL